MTADPSEERPTERMAEAARQAAERAQRAVDDPEPSLGSRLAQIGVLGWMIVAPMLLGQFAGRWLDRRFDTGIMFSGAMLMAGTAVGLWSAWKWMHRHV